MENTIDWAKYKGFPEEGKVRLLKEGSENGNALCQFGYGYHLKEIISSPRYGNGRSN